VQLSPALVILSAVSAHYEKTQQIQKNGDIKHAKMSTKYLFKSGVNMQIPLIFCVFAFFTFNSIWVLSEDIIYKTLIIILLPALFYLLLYYWVSRCYFYDDWFEIKYFFRLKRRVFRYSYNEISSIKYLCTYSKYSPPTLILKVFKAESKKKNINYSFPVKWYKNRRDILRYLSSKGLPIEIDSIKEKDEDILS